MLYHHRLGSSATGNQEMPPGCQDKVFSNMPTIEQVLEVLAQSVPIPEDMREMGAHAPLLGAIPELDSLAITGIIAELEKTFGIGFDADELDAQAFNTVGTLRDLVATKLAGRA